MWYVTTRSVFRKKLTIKQRRWLLKKKRIKYRKKRCNVDTLEVNAIQTSHALGVHAPDEIDISKLRRKKRE